MQFGDKVPRAIDDLAEQDENDSVVRAFDRAVLAQGLRDSRQALEQGSKYVAVVPLHAASLKSEPDRQWMLSVLKEQPDPIPKLMVLELIDSQAIRWADLTRHVWSFHKTCRRIVLRQALVLATAGVVCGGIAALIMSRLLTTMLFEVQPSDPVTYGGIAVVLAGTAVLAAWWPARRAAAVDPVVALRSE